MQVIYADDDAYGSMIMPMMRQFACNRVGLQVDGTASRDRGKREEGREALFLIYFTGAIIYLFISGFSITNHQITAQI
jgi:hypothetical protein